MNGTKDWYASSGVWGGIIATFSPFVGPMLAHAGVALTPDLQAALAGALASIGGLVALVGRMRATTIIQATKK